MKTVLKILSVLLVLFVTFPAVPALAAGIQATQAQVVIPPEFSEWAIGIATSGAWLLLVIVLDLILGVVSALKAKVFEWRRLADFLGSYGPKVVGWLALEVLGLLPSDLAVMAGVGNALGVGAYAIILISAVGSVLGHVKALGLLPANVPGIKADRG